MNRKFLTESLPIFILPYCILASTAGSASGHSLGNGLESDTDSLRQPTKAGIVLKDVVVEGNGYSKDMQMRSALSTISAARSCKASRRYPASKPCQ